MSSEWKQPFNLEKDHFILQGKKFHISFIEYESSPSQELYPRPNETALVNKNTCLILIGDYRKEYEQLISKGYNACKKFYKSKHK